MKTLFALLMLSTAAYAGNTPLPIPRPAGAEGSNCPSGYYLSGGSCAPISARSRPAIQSNGPNCPTGHYLSGSACLKY